jgi:hypothetical protein
MLLLNVLFSLRICFSSLFAAVTLALDLCFEQCDSLLFSAALNFVTLSIYLLL